MDTQVRRKLEMVDRVLGFIGARTAIEPAYGPALARLQEQLTRARGILTRQHDGRDAARAANAHRVKLRRALQLELTHYLVAIGSIATKGQEVASRFKLPSPNTTNAAFIVAVSSLLALGEAQRDVLVKAGLSATLLDELARMVSDFETATVAARDARRDHIEARIELDSITTELTEQVNLLDGITRYRFGFDSDVMSEWKMARVLLGQPRNGAVPPATPTPTPQPPTPQPGEVQRAA
jgi:hypothetical protein